MIEVTQNKIVYIHITPLSCSLFRFKDGLEIQDSPRIQSEVIENRGVAQLVITGATVRDIGLYTLEAHNLAGRAKSMVRISVRGNLQSHFVYKYMYFNRVVNISLFT